VDTAPVHGLWVTCGASLSPWNTHLSSEEYEPDAFATGNAQLLAFSQNLYGDQNKANPYHYGHMPEVTVNADGTASIKKHFCMGRISHELVQVMPDQRTALMGDDATNSGYFVFVADKEKDLSSGSLYVAKVGAGFSIDPASGSAAALTWIKLGSATSAEIKALVDGGIKAADILDVSKTDPGDASYTKITANGKVEWIKINPGMDKAAAFLETHRYAAFKGASMGFTKMEGTTVNAKDKVAYSALQNCEKSMVAGDALNVAGNGVSIPKQLKAGAVMALNLRGGQKDTAGAAINSEWMPVDTKALLAGEDISADALGNTGNPNKICNPDNLKFSEKMRTLFIGEDSGQHVNNFLWAYNIDTKQLSRLMSIPAGGESTGLHAVDEINGWTYIMSNFQHAGDWGAIHNVVKPTLDPLISANYRGKFGAAVGYLTGTAAQPKLSA
jgi:secreted PhoX family phosphatase